MFTAQNGSQITQFTRPQQRKQRSRLNTIKCCFCRNAKQGCGPIARQWPGEKCLRCLDKNLPCSEGRRAKRSTQQSMRRIETSSPPRSREPTLAPKSAPSSTDHAQTPTSNTHIYVVPNNDSPFTTHVQTREPLLGWTDTTKVRKALTLLSIHTVLIIALKELKELVHDMSKIFLNDPYCDDPGHALLDVKRAFETYKTFAIEVKNRILYLGAGETLLLEAYATLETDYSHHSITCDSDGTTHHMSSIMTKFEDYGHHGVVHAMQLKKLLSHDSIDNDECVRLVDTHCLFLKEVAEVLKTEFVGHPVALNMCGSQMFIPKELLKNAAIRELVLKIGLRDCLGRSVLHILLDAGNAVDWFDGHINIPDYLGRSALYVACRNGHKAMTEALLQKNADFDFQALNGLKPLHIAACMGHTAICNMIWEHSLGRHLEFEILTNVRMGSHLLDQYGRSPLLWAALCGQKDTVHRLCELTLFLFPTDPIGLAATDRDYFGSTAVILATCGGYVDVLNYLLDYQVVLSRFPPDIADNRGCTAESYARNGHRHNIKDLLQGSNGKPYFLSFMQGQVD